VSADAPIKFSEIPDKFKVFLKIFTNLKESIRQWTTDLNHGHIKINGLFFDKNDTIDTVKTKVSYTKLINFKTQGGDSIKLNVFTPHQTKRIKNASGKTYYLAFRGSFTSYAYTFSKKSILKDCFLVT
jgi:hypothetical protein